MQGIFLLWEILKSHRPHSLQGRGLYQAMMSARYSTWTLKIYYSTEQRVIAKQHWFSKNIQSLDTDYRSLKKGNSAIFQALRYWKILFSPSDFEPTSVRNCQFLTLPVRNCQHADPYQVLGLERSEQQCVLDTRRHQPTPTRCWGLNNLPEDFSNMNCFHFTRCAEKPCQ